MKERKNYLDNIRWMTVILVMVYHVVYIFNSQGVLSNFHVQGIEVLDGFLYIVYPWFMAILFVVAGASARYALSKRTGKAFLKDRLKRLIVPSIFVPIFFGWFCGWVTNFYGDMFQGNGDQIPGIVKYIIFCMSGEGKGISDGGSSALRAWLLCLYPSCHRATGNRQYPDNGGLYL